MDLVYGAGWYFSEANVHPIWPEEKARKAHATKKPYGVAITIDGVRRYGLDVNEVNDGVGVTYLFHADNAEWSLIFARQDPVTDKAVKTGDLFLHSAGYRVWTGVPHNSSFAFGELHRHYTHGKDQITTVIEGPEGKSTTRTFRDLDTRKLWTPWPEFGHYETFLDLQHWLDAAKIDLPRRP